MIAHRTRLGAKAYLGAIGQILAELLIPLAICAAGIGFLFAIEVHPYISLSAATIAVAGTVFLFGRRAARDGRPWPPPMYLIATLATTAVVGIAVVVVISLRGICGCF